MSKGNLEGKLVVRAFWPACTNCRFFEACKVRPKHPAYPHSWHWGRECAEFADGTLIVRSWVGTIAIGQPHTGCTSYEVDPRYIREPQAHHRCYLEREHEKGRLEAQMAHLETKAAWSQHDEDVHAGLFQRYRHVLAQQTALRSTAPDTQPLAAAVNA
jgi:hypothetical protein